MCTAHPACHCIPSSLSRELQGTEPQGRARRLTPHWHAHTASPRDAAASLLGLCKAFSFDCLVPCVRGRILSAEKSLVRASAAVERQEIRGHPLVFPGRPPQGPGTHVSPRNRGPAAPTPLWLGEMVKCRLLATPRPCRGPLCLQVGSLHRTRLSPSALDWLAQERWPPAF